jgi:polysaccharide biosynthesis protein PslJ
MVGDPIGIGGGTFSTELPAWPFTVMYWWFPILWLLGVGVSAPVLFALVMLAYLVLLPDVRIPRVLLPWFALLVVVLGSGVTVDTVGRAVGFAYRFGNYAAATIFALYVYNASNRTLSDRRVIMGLAAFWSWIVLGGLLGVLFPEQSIRTPLSFVLPGFLLSNELVQAWVVPNFSEVQQPWGSPEAFYRPSAPFAYTNGWGCNFALLFPFAITAFTMLHGWRRWTFGGVIILSAVPVAATLNRGMFLALGIGLAYVLLRLALRGRFVPLLGMAVLASVAGFALVGAGVIDRILLRTTYSTTNLGREAIYRETFQRTLESPLLGWGGPRPSRLIDVSVGTQGHIWNVMFSHGFVALVLFVFSIVLFAWRTRHAAGPRFAAHVTLVMSATAIIYYGFDGPQMVTVLVATALALRPRSPSGAEATAEVAEHLQPLP